MVLSFYYADMLTVESVYTTGYVRVTKVNTGALGLSRCNRVCSRCCGLMLRYL